MITLKEHIEAGVLEGNCITLNIVDKEGNCYISNTLTFVRIEEYEFKPDFMYFSGMKSDSFFVSKNKLNEYILYNKDLEGFHYMFKYIVGE